MSAALSFLPDTSPAEPCEVPVRRPRHLHAVPVRPALSPVAPAVPASPAPRAVSVLAPPADAERVRVRLTRRGMAVLAVLAAAVGGALVWLATVSAPAAGPAPAEGRAPAVVTVRGGDTLWSIAGRTAPGADPRAEVDRLRRLNHLDGATGVTLRPGQHLRTR
ncbi:LysM peptidoglycan-binding domain-containing protein [Jatrophihabitans fulvus]